MARPVLLLRLEGPLQAWGGRSRWDVRDTGPMPTKSGVVGLLGCALGIPSGDARLEHELDAGLRFGVRVELPGVLLQDYQTVQGFLPTAEGSYRHSGVQTGTSLAKIMANPDNEPATIVSPRMYLQDAAFLVALEEQPSAPEGLLDRCARAVQRPHWPLYLGRKACIPTRPVFEALADTYGGLEDALRHHPWQQPAGKALKARIDVVRQRGLEVEIEDPRGELLRLDAVRTNALRVFGFRQARALERVFPWPDATESGG